MAIGEATRRLGNAVARAYDVFVVADRAGRILLKNRELPGSGENIADHFSVPAREDIIALHARVADTGVADCIEVTSAFTGAETTHYQLSVSPFEDEGETLLLDVAVEVTARRRREEALLRNEGLMIDTQGVAHLGTWEWDVSEPTATWSAELYRIYAVTPDTYTPSYEGYLQKVHPEDRAAVKAATERVFTEHKPYSHDERIIRPDGSIRYLHTWARAILNEKGELWKLIGVCQDITDRKVAENALAEQNELLKKEIEERERIEARLLQTHKLEAIGRLAGGIAHDFNNLLGVVIGRASLLQSRLPENDSMRPHLEEITSVGKHAARLTQQLLAFSREQSIRREQLDLCKVVVDLERLLRRLISENIELVTTTDREPCLVVADRSQIDQVVMNLVVNARDAMPRGGRIAVETKAVARGSSILVDATPFGSQRVLSKELDPNLDYVSLAVSDTGVGMDGGTLDRIFDPYFTTKDEGKGNGLGLSTVYGIVKQSKGSLSVESAPGKGTRFTIYLPRAEAPSAIAEEETHEDVRGGHELVLLCEDQAPLRLMLRQILEDRGYAVLEAETPGEALRLTQDMGSRISLLVTDIVMPRMSGAELGVRVRAIDSKIRVIYISGHGDDSLLNQEVLDGGGTILRKPFTSLELARAVRESLDAKT